MYYYYVALVMYFIISIKILVVCRVRQSLLYRNTETKNHWGLLGLGGNEGWDGFSELPLLPELRVV